MNSDNPVCPYVISNWFVMPYYEGKVFFYEGGVVNKTQLSDWQAVTDYAHRLDSCKTQPDGKIWFGLTRTLLVLLGHSRETGLFVTQDLFFARYAPF